MLKKRAQKEAELAATQAQERAQNASPIPEVSAATLQAELKEFVGVLLKY